MLTIQRRPWLVRILREIFYTFANPLQRIYWYIFRPYRPGAKTLIFHEGKVLMVKLGYAHKCWVFPGGGIERGESPEVAAIREAREESGLVITNSEFVGERSYTNQYKKVTVFYFTANATTTDLVIDGQEIADAGWFSLDTLPTPVRPRVFEEIEMYNNWKHGKN